jgi:hypothetical protein
MPYECRKQSEHGELTLRSVTDTLRKSRDSVTDTFSSSSYDVTSCISDGSNALAERICCGA